MAIVAHYIYVPLSAPDAIRVLELHPAKRRSDPLLITLKESSLPSDWHSDNYDALSYVWGAKTGDCPIACDGKQLYVTKNCETALRYLRFKESRRALWIDAICINQNDDEEKSNQVQMMGEIYRLGWRTIVWLGEADALTAPAFRLLNHSNNEKLPATISYGIFRTEVRLRQRRHAHLGRRSDGSKIRDFAAVYMCSLLDNPYFHRIWTVQESAIASLPMVMCGSSSLPLSVFDVGARRFYWHKRIVERDGQIFVPAQRLKAFQHHTDCSRKLSDGSHVSQKQPEQVWTPTVKREFLDALVYTAHSHQASNPKDRVFVYNDAISINSVYIEATRAMIRDGKSLDILNNISTEGRDPALPSWALDFRSQPSEPLLGRWHASQDTNVDYSLGDGQGAHFLRLKGIAVGAIARQGSALPSDGLFRVAEQINLSLVVVASSLHNWLQLFLDYASIPPSITYESPSDALWNVLLAGLEVESRVRASYDAWWSNSAGRAPGSIPSHVMDAYLNFDQEALRSDTDADMEAMRLFFPFLNSLLDGTIMERRRVEGIYQQIKSWLGCMWTWHRGRRFFITETGSIGLSPNKLQPHDQIVIFAGASRPMIVRPKGAHFLLIGPAMVHGIMNGEAWPDERSDALEDFTLV